MYNACIMYLPLSSFVSHFFLLTVQGVNSCISMSMCYHAINANLRSSICISSEGFVFCTVRVVCTQGICVYLCFHAHTSTHSDTSQTPTHMVVTYMCYPSCYCRLLSRSNKTGRSHRVFQTGRTTKYVGVCMRHAKHVGLCTLFIRAMYCDAI